MRLNPKKCKVMDINFLQYQPGPLAPITIKGCPVHQVQTYKLLGVHVAHDLSWNTHIEHIVTKASKRLYALRLLRKSGVACADLVSIYCALIRSVLEYAAPVWAALPLYLDNLIESTVQRKALRIISRPSTITAPCINLSLRMLERVFSCTCARNLHTR